MKRLLFLTLISTLVFALNLSGAEEESEEVSSLQNPAQAQKAENIAEASLEAAQSSADTNLADAQTAVDDAQAAYDADPNEQTQAALQSAQSDLEAAQESLSEISGVSSEEIGDMRSSGMGWGEIAHEVGVHPSVLGLGHTKQMQAKERVRDTTNMSSQGTNSANSGAKAYGLSKSSKAQNANSGKGNNNAGGNGKGGGKGK